MKSRRLLALALLWPLAVAAQSTFNLEFVRFSPAAIFGDGADSSTIQVRVTGAVASVQMTSPLNLDLFDDGTHGDIQAGDQIYTRSGITFGSLSNTTLAAQIKITPQSGSPVSTIPLESRLYVVSPSQRIAISKLSDDVQAGPNIVNLRDDGQLMGLTPSTSTIFPLNLWPITRKLYEYFADDYDFISILTAFGTWNGTNYHLNARNDVQGIGQVISNNTSLYGSAGKLLGINYTPLQAGALMHETTHTWAAYLDRSLELDDGVHWGAVNIPGFVFGLNFRANADGSYTITQVQSDINRVSPPMELYLMGLIPPEEVPPTTVLRGISPLAVSVGQVVNPASVRNVSISDVIAVHGPRIPSVATSPKSFHMAGVLITPGRLASEAEMAAYNRMLQQFGSDETASPGDFGVGRPPFAFATGYRARMDTTIVNAAAPAPASQRTIPTTSGSTVSWYTADNQTGISSGSARIQTASAGSVPNGIAIFGSRQNAALVSEASVPSSAPVTRGRIFAEIATPVNTGIAIANPNAQASTVSFYFTDSSGRDFGQSSLTVPAGGQIARFLNEDPFNGPASFTGTLTFSSSLPVGAIALRGRNNERGEFLMTTLPVIDPAAPAETPGISIVPHFAEGGGWRTELLLVNPTETSISGTVEFWGPGSPAAPASRVAINVDGQTASSVSYAIPPKSSRRIRTSGAPAVTVTGSARILPDGANASPAGLIVFSFVNNGATVSEAGVPAVRAATTALMYAQTFAPAGDAGSIQTGLAMANPSDSPATVSIRLTGYDGAAYLNPVSVTIPANGQKAFFLNQVPGFESLSFPSIFQGTAAISTTASGGIAIAGLRGRYNERGDFLITSMPLFPAVASSTEKMFPHIVDGGGYSTQFVFPNLTATDAVLRFFTQSGGDMPLQLR